MNKLPNHMLETFGTLREFKQIKRFQMRTLKSALNALRLGCVYMPNCQSHINVIERNVAELSLKISHKNWGR